MSKDIYTAGDAIRIRALIRNSENVLMDPDTSIQISIDDPDGTAKVTDQAMTKDDIGDYSYIYQSDTADDKGKYEVTVEAVHGSYTALMKSILFRIG